MLYCKTGSINFQNQYPGSEVKIGEDYYLLNQFEKPSIENPYGIVEVAKASKYKYQINENYQTTKELNTNMTIGIGVVATLAGGLVSNNNKQWYSDEKDKTNAFSIGAAVVGLSYLILGALLLPNKIEVKTVKPGIEYEYKVDEILKNTEISVKNKNEKKTFVSDAKGLLKYSPPFDFHLNEFKTNDSVEFIFERNGSRFLFPLKLRPSDWLETYARITYPKIQIYNSENENIGFAREGMLYKVIGQNDENISIQVGSKKGWIKSKEADVIYTSTKGTDLTPAIKGYVMDEMQNWMKQGEFELPEDYLNRISKKEEQLQVLTNEAMKTFQKEYIDMFDWNKSTISNYDPNSQTFRVSIPELKEIVIQVPIQYAKTFKNNWNSVLFKNQEFTMINGNWELVSLQIEDPSQSYVAEYNSKLNNNYDPVNQFAFDVKEFEPDLSKLNLNKINNQLPENNSSDRYIINTNLPQTDMQQPEAIAVIIGNSLYEKTDPVNFALNDAQLMKLYLINVLGFKEGNIIFTMNAGKAEFEGLFGTEANYKGKLFNYIKPNVSDVFIFYSGHGAPDPATSEPYFVPTDCDPAYLNLQGYALKTMYSNLAKLPSKSTTIIIDACFSGAGVLKNLSSVRIKPKDTENDIPNCAILNSSSGEQVSSWYNEMKHGLFTYFFLKAVHDYKNSDKNGDKQLTFDEIYEYISDKTSGIPYFARRLNAVEQTPVLKGNKTDRTFVFYKN